MGVRLVSHLPYNTARPAGYQAILSHTHTYSGRADHGGTTLPPESYRQLAAWTRRLGIAALGMGSPYTPVTSGQYSRFDDDPEMTYYGRDFDRRPWRGDEEIAVMLEQVNGFSEGETLFYLDNETPKARYGHLWWINYHLDVPAWHDYDQPFDRWMVHEATPEQDGEAEPMPYERRPYREILAAQRAAGALGIWAHPTSWWRGGNGQFITNIASEMPAHAFADGFLDGMVVMGYHAYRPEYLAVWFALLDRGLRVPGVAEMDCGLSDAGLWRKERAYLTLVPGDGQPRSSADVAAAWRGGQLIASSGVWAEMQVDGRPMGSVVRTGADKEHTVRMSLGGQSERYRVQLMGQGGRVLWEEQTLRPGLAEFKLPGLSERGYIVPVIQGLCDSGAACSEVCAVGNPAYLHPSGQDFARPISSEVSLAVSPQSRWRGGRLRVEDAGGELLETVPLCESTVKFQAPAGGRITLADGDGSVTKYLINENERLTSLQRYLYRGGFTRDFTSARSGEVPVEAWRLDEFEAALRSVELEI